MNKKLIRNYLQLLASIALCPIYLPHLMVFMLMGETVRKLRPEPAFTQAIRPKS